MNVLDVDTIALEEALLEGDLDCRISSHLCVVVVTHAVVTTCGENVPCCVIAAALQSGRIRRNNALCRNCGKAVRDCWRVIPI